jgi:KaiC/GvpD/RAD55 family RecA-like ATPase
MIDIIKKQLEVLGHEEGKDITELRFLPSAKQVFVRSAAEVADAIKDTKENVYIGINPRFRSDGSSRSVSRVTCVVVDIDPIRDKDTPSTEDQHKGAMALGKKISDDFGGGVVVSSGSGCHVYFPIEHVGVVNADALGQSLKEWCDEVKKIYRHEEYKIDSIWDLPRVIRLWGSTNLRSNRPCTPVEGLETYKRFAWKFKQEPKPVLTSDRDISSETESRFNRLALVNEKLKHFLDGTTSYPSPSEYDFAFVLLLAKAHFTIEEIESLWHHNKNGNKEPKKGDVARIVGKVKKDSTDTSFSLAHNSGTYFENLKHRKMGYSCGIPKLDEMLSGFQPGKMYILAARPNQGKTTLCMQILTTFAENDLPCLMFPTEVGAEPLIDKIISRKTGVNLKKFQNGNFTEMDDKLIRETRQYIAGLPLVIVEDFGIDVDKLISSIDSFAPRVVCLDYFQALKWKDSGSVGEKESAVHKLKKITKDRNLITLVMSQLKRGDPTQQGKASMSELKGTGALEELGDVVGQMYTMDTFNYPRDVDLTITKSKYSATGNIPLKFWSSTGKFEESNEQPKSK